MLKHLMFAIAFSLSSQIYCASSSTGHTSTASTLSTLSTSATTLNAEQLWNEFDSGRTDFKGDELNSIAAHKTQELSTRHAISDNPNNIYALVNDALTRHPNDANGLFRFRLVGKLISKTFFDTAQKVFIAIKLASLERDNELRY